MSRRYRFHGAEPFVSHSRYGAARSKAVLKKYPNHADRLARAGGECPWASHGWRAESAVGRPVTAGYPVVTKEFGSAAAAIWGGADAQTTLTKAAKAIDQNFADNNGYKP